MSWSFSGKARDAAFASEVKRCFDMGRGQVQGSPASVRALDAIEALVAQAPLNIPAGAESGFETNGHLEQNGRGAFTVKVAIGDPPPAS